MAEYQTKKTKHAVYNTLRCLGGVLFGERRFKQPKFLENAAQKDKYEMWLAMIDAGKINEAENKLYELMDGKDMTKLHLALLFYEHLLDLPEEFLTEHGFSREEILDGVKNAADIYGVGGLAETLIS